MHHLSLFAPDDLTLKQANEAAYCLGLVILYNESSATNMYALDTCDSLMNELWAEQKPFTAFTAVERATALGCVSDRAIVGGAKRASMGALDWMPINILSTSGGGQSLITTMLPTGLDMLKARAHTSIIARDPSLILVAFT